LSTPREDLIRAVTAARDQAKRFLTALEQEGHPETSRSNALYLALVLLRKRLMKEAPTPAAVMTELEQLLALCEGKLARVKPELEDALKIARGG
jgi:hypothetical protein